MTRSLRGVSNFPGGDFEKRNRRFSLSSTKETKAAKVAPIGLRRRRDQLVDEADRPSRAAPGEPRSSSEWTNVRYRPRREIQRKPARAAERAGRNLEEGGELGASGSERPAGTGRPTGREAGTREAVAVLLEQRAERGLTPAAQRGRTNPGSAAREASEQPADRASSPPSGASEPPTNRSDRR